MILFVSLRPRVRAYLRTEIYTSSGVHNASTTQCPDKLQFVGQFSLRPAFGIRMRDHRTESLTGIHAK